MHDILHKNYIVMPKMSYPTMQPLVMLGFAKD
jgi:hypothetical protein